MSSLTTVDGVTYVITDDGTAHALTAAPVASVPAAPVAGSPFAIIATRKADGTADSMPAPIRDVMAAAPDGKRQEYGRQAAAYHAVPLYSCTATTREMNGPDGVRTVGHGFISKREAGAACPTNGCAGTIRA